MKTVNPLNIRSIEKKSSHFVRDIIQAENAAYAEYYGQDFVPTVAPVTPEELKRQHENAEMMKRLTVRFATSFDSVKIAGLRKPTRIVFEAGEQRAFVQIELFTDKAKDSVAKGSNTNVKTRNNGVKLASVLSEHSDDDVLYLVTIGMNLHEDNASLLGSRFAAIKRAPAKSEVFEMFHQANGEFDGSGVELPAVWLKAKMKDFMNDKIKNEWAGNERNGFSLVTVKTLAKK